MDTSWHVLVWNGLIFLNLSKVTNAKFEPYINKLADAIRSFNPKMPWTTAQSMAKVGIIRGSELYDWEKQLNQNEREAKNHQGTKCP